MNIKKYYTNDICFALITSITLTFLVFLPFIGQWLFSDIVTFMSDGDSIRQIYPVANRLGQRIVDGVFAGVDVARFNGATNFNMASGVCYPPFMIFSALGQYFPLRGTLLIYTALHFFIMIFFCQRLAVSHYKLNRYVGLLFAVSCTTPLLCNAWFLPYFVRLALSVPLIYLSILVIKGVNRKYWFFIPLPVILVFTSSVTPYTVALILFAYLYSLIYGIVCSDVKNRDVFIRLTAMYCVGGIVCFPYYLEVISLLKNTLAEHVSTMNTSLSLPYKFGLLGVLFSAKIPPPHAEQQRILFIGLIWGIVILMMIRFKVISSLPKPSKTMFWLGLIPSLIILVVATGNATPLGAWFYAIPMFGQGHLPIRYLTATLPMMFLSLCIAFAYFAENINTKPSRIQWIFLGFTIAIASVGRYTPISTIFNMELLIFELFLTTAILFTVNSRGWLYHSVLTLWAFTLILNSATVFYSSMEIAKSSHTFRARSIVFNPAINTFNNFIDTLDKKELYKFANNEKTVQPLLIPEHLGWYGDVVRHNIGNYSGYPLHAGVPNEYRARFPAYDLFDWDYMKNTRATFFITAEKDITTVIWESIDWEHQTPHLMGGVNIYKLKQFIPLRYTEGKYIVDRKDALDNGYFYGHNLNMSDIIDFQTNKATYFEITVNAGDDAELSFLLEPNRFFRYYLDSQEIEPIIDSGLLYFPIAQGQHKLEIKYVNIFDIVSMALLYGYIAIALAWAILLLLALVHRRVYG